MTTSEVEDGPTARVSAVSDARTTAERQALRSEVIESLLPLAERLARRYRGLGVALEDLCQVAATGLIKSVDGYRPELGPFVPYAVPTITGELRRYLRDRAWAVRPPRRLQELALRVHHAVESLSAERRRMPQVTELAEVVGAPAEEIRGAMAAFRAYMAVSLDSAPRPDGPAPLGEMLAGSDDGIDALVDRLALRAALTRLAAREQAIIRMRFLDELTQQEIAAALGISQAHVSGILARTLRALRMTLSAEGGEPAVGPARTPASGCGGRVGRRPTRAPRRHTRPACRYRLR